MDENVVFMLKNNNTITSEQSTIPYTPQTIIQETKWPLLIPFFQKMPAPSPVSSDADLMVSQFILSMSKGEMETSYNMAVKTAEMVKSLVECYDWGMADQLIKKVREVCKRLEEELPQLHVVHNMIK